MSLRDRWDDFKDWVSEIDISESLDAIAAGASAGGAAGAIAGGGVVSWATAPVLAGVGAGVGLVGSLVDDFGRIGENKSSNPSDYYSKHPGPLARDGFPVSGVAVLNDNFVLDLLEVVKSYYETGSKELPSLVKNMISAKKRGVIFKLDDEAKTTFSLGLEDVRKSIELVEKGLKIAEQTNWGGFGSVFSTASDVVSRWE